MDCLPFFHAHAAAHIVPLMCMLSCMHVTRAACFILGASWQDQHANSPAVSDRTAAALLSQCSVTQIADKKWGVIGVRYRQVDCGKQPDQWAYSGSPTMGIFPTVEEAMTHKDSLDW